MKIFYLLFFFSFLCNCKNEENKNEISNNIKTKTMSDTTKIIFNAKPISTKIDSLNFSIELKNIGIDSLFIDTVFTLGYDDDKDANIYYKVLKLTDNGTYKSLDEKNSDYQYLAYYHGKILLPKGKSFKKNVYIIYTDFKKNDTYKIKFFYRLSKYGNYDDIHTDWVKFEVY